MSQLANLKLLIADDHFLIRQFVRNALQDTKITNVQTAADGNEAIDLVQKAHEASQAYDIVFLDWNMPTISGLEVLSYFRAKPEYANTAFVMLTAEFEQQKHHEGDQGRRDILHHQAGFTVRPQQETVRNSRMD